MEPLTTMTRVLEFQGSSYLGIRVASGKGTQALIRLLPPSERKGILLSDGGMEEWKILGFSEVEGELYLYGPPISPTPELFCGLLTHAPVQSLPPRLSLLVRRLAQLGQRNALPRKLYPEGIFFLNDGRVLFLPETIMEKVVSLEPLEQRIQWFESFNHPDLEAEGNASFFLAVLTYRLCVGRFPFQSDSEETLRSVIRSLPPLPARLARPGLHAELSSFLQKALTAPQKPSLSEWEGEISRLSSTPLLSSLSREEEEELAREASRFLSDQKRSFKRRNFWAQYRTRILGGVAVLLVVAYFAYDVLSQALRPPRTLGLTPQQVALLFYSSMNTLDHQAMQECVKGKAGKAYIDEVTQLFVISRMRMSVELKSGMVDAESWYRKGKPMLKENETLYGVADLAIETVTQGPHSAEFTVRYDRWVPIPGEPSKDTPKTSVSRFQGFRVEERVRLQREGERWVIVDIQPLSRSTL